MTATESTGETMRVRLQKLLSEAGVASRRRAEELILEGRVLVDDRIVDTLPAFVDPRAEKVLVDGIRVRIQPHEYFLVHKPKGVVCTNRDLSGRPRAMDLLPPLKARLFVVGRLDADSTGLLLMTNDGELAERITHPRFGVPKVYRAEVRGVTGDDLPARLRKGIYLSDGKARVSEVEIVHRSRQRTILQITLREGRNRQVRRMLARLGHPVRKLKRIGIGPLVLKRLPVGAARRLTPRELDALRRAVEDAAAGRARIRRSPRQPSGKPGTRRKTVPGAKPTSPTRAVRATAQPRPRGTPKRRLIT